MHSKLFIGLAIVVQYMSQYTVIYKYGKRTRPLKIKRNLEKKSFPQVTLAEGGKSLCTEVE